MKIGLAGSFGFSIGLGHLFRLKAIYSALKDYEDVAFLSQSSEQANLFNALGIHFKDINEFDCDRVIYDGRAKIAEFPKDNSIKFPKSILIDNVENFEPTFGKSVVPSFYISEANHKKIKDNFDQHFIGIEYFFIRRSKIKETNCSR